jgi:single-strand DNA-binding protein
MNNLNSILIEGNLTRDPELAYTPKGTPICRFSIATNRFYKQEEEYQKEVSYFDVTVWAKQAEVCSEYLKKGRGVRVVGRLKQDRWQDSEGNNRSKVLIIAEHVEFRPKKESPDDANDKSALPDASPNSQEGASPSEGDQLSGAETEKEEQLTL